MSSSEFALFSRLPRELQLQIWEEAARPIAAERQVQFFMVEDHTARPANPPQAGPGHFLRLGAEGRVNGGFKLAVPCPNTNDSTYSLDSGVWTACLDANAAMQKSYDSDRWWPALNHSGRPATSHTAPYIDGEGSKRRITFRPSADLFYFAPLKLTQVEWWRQYAYDEVPLFRSVAGEGFLGLNLAVTYDPMMMNVLHKRPRMQCRHTWSWVSEGALADIVDLFHELIGCTMWFVDLRLQRRADATPRREQFYSQSCVFTEVTREDMRQTWMLGTNDSQETAFDMFDKLNENCGGRLELEASERMRVLACEPLPGKSPLAWLQPEANELCDNCALKQQQQEAERVQRAVVRAREDDLDIDLTGFSLFD